MIEFVYTSYEEGTSVGRLPVPSHPAPFAVPLPPVPVTRTGGLVSTFTRDRTMDEAEDYIRMQVIHSIWPPGEYVVCRDGQKIGTVEMVPS